MNRRIGLGIGAVLAVVSFAGAAEAQEANGFGAAHQLILSADRLVPVFGYSSESVTSHPNDNTTVTSSTHGSSISLLFGSSSEVQTVHTIPRAAGDFTVIDRLTVGGFVALGFGLGGSSKVETSGPGVTRSSSTDAPTTTIIGFGPRVGYILPLGDVLAFWPRGGLSFYSIRTRSTDQNNNVTTTTTNSNTLLSLDVDPQLCIVPLQHFFLNVGPLLAIPLTGSQTRETTAGNTTNSTSNDFSQFHIGISAGLGGWFDL